MSELKLENVSYRYKKGDRDVLSGVSCVFSGGQLSAVVGPSGSGKTTLLSIMAGLDVPVTGAVYINGVNLKKMDLDLYRQEQVSMIFQAYHLFPLLTAMENVCYPMEMSGVKRAQAKLRAKELLTAVGIGDDLINRFPSHLSGGEQQRVSIARALSSGAKVLLADEPTGNLDTANGDIVMDILRRLAHNDGYCVVVVTHDMAIAEASDIVCRMTDGVLLTAVAQ